MLVQVTLTTPYHQLPSHSMLDFKRLCLNLFNIVNLFTLKAVLVDHPTRLKKYRLYSNRNFQSQLSKR